jgi:hypothetical protein
MRKLVEKSGKAVRSTVKMSKEQFAAKCAKDTNAYKSDYKRVPLPTGSTVVAKYVNIDGVPHKNVDGVFVPLIKKA